MSQRIQINKELFIKAVANNITIAGVIRDLGKNPKSFSQYKVVHRYVRIFNLDTSHWVGQSHSKGKKFSRGKAPLKELFSIDGNYDTTTVKKRIISENIIPYECSNCHINTWDNKPLSLQLDHINGINYDHRLENLRFLCPNCHSQTNTFCGKNNSIIPGKTVNDKVLCDCGNTKNYYSITCKSCADKKPKGNKIVCPNNIDLIKMINDSSYVQVGKLLGVSDKAVSKRIKKLNLQDLIT